MYAPKDCRSELSFNIIDEWYKYKKGNVTKFKTGRRFFFADLPKINLPETVKLGSGPIGLFYRGQIRAQKAGIATDMGNGDTGDEAGDRETSDEEKSKSEEENNSEEKSKSEEENKSEEKSKSEEENNSEEKSKSEEENNSEEKSKSEEENNSEEKSKSEEENNSEEKSKSEEENNSEEKSKSEEENNSEEKSKSEEKNNSEEKSKSEEENKSEQEASPSSHVHATAGKNRCLKQRNWKRGNQNQSRGYWKTRLTTMSSVMGLNPQRAKQRQHMQIS